MKRSVTVGLGMLLFLVFAFAVVPAQSTAPGASAPPSETATTTIPADTPAGHGGESDYWSHLFVFVLASFIGLGVIARVSRLLHTPLMSLTNAISAIAVIGAIIVAGNDYPAEIRILGAIAVFASMTNIVSGFLITERMLKMFKQTRREEHS